MGRHTDAGLRAIVYQNLAARQFARDFVAIGHVQHHDSAALLRIAARVDTQAGLEGQFDEARGLAHGFFANRGHTDEVDDLIAGAGRVHCGYVGRTVQKAEDAAGVAYRAAFESERLFVRSPAGGGRAELFPEVAPHVEVSGAWTAAEPLHAAAGGEIDA